MLVASTLLHFSFFLFHFFWVLFHEHYYYYILINKLFDYLVVI